MNYKFKAGDIIRATADMQGTPIKHNDICTVVNVEYRNIRKSTMQAIGPYVELTTICKNNIHVVKNDYLWLTLQFALVKHIDKNSEKRNQ